MASGCFGNVIMLMQFYLKSVYLTLYYSVIFEAAPP